MRTSFLVFAVLVCACTKHNPDSCCTSDPQCQAFGLDGVTACETGKVCNSFGTCVASECVSSADCQNPALPVCIDQQCVATCTMDADCTGIAGAPYCASNGACVACTNDTQCTAEAAPVCDTHTNTCRSCSADADCASGVCLEATGTCAGDGQVVFVKGSGTDTGTCTKASPCATLTYAVTQTSGTRNVIHIVGQTYHLATSVTFTNFVGYVDGENTVISDDNLVQWLFAGGTVTISEVSMADFKVNGADVTLFDSALLSPCGQTNGTLTVDHSTLAGSIVCSAGTLNVTNSTVTGTISTRTCPSKIERDLVQDVVLSFAGGTVAIDDNVFLSTQAGAEPAVVLLPGLTAGVTGAIEFNTLMNHASAVAAGPAIDCQGGATPMITSNILAWNSAVTPTCATQYSLYDKALALPAGTGNIAGDPATFFTNLTGNDFHLATASPAIGAADPNIASPPPDFEGTARPSPAGSKPDIGAYEAQ